MWNAISFDQDWNSCLHVYCNTSARTKTNKHIHTHTHIYIYIYIYIYKERESDIWRGMSEEKLNDNRLRKKLPKRKIPRERKIENQKSRWKMSVTKRRKKKKKKNWACLFTDIFVHFPVLSICAHIKPRFSPTDIEDTNHLENWHRSPFSLVPKQKRKITIQL